MFLIIPTIIIQYFGPKNLCSSSGALLSFRMRLVSGRTLAVAVSAQPEERWGREVTFMTLSEDQNVLRLIATAGWINFITGTCISRVVSNQELLIMRRVCAGSNTVPSYLGEDDVTEVAITDSRTRSQGSYIRWDRRKLLDCGSHSLLV